jgi:CRISPR/Cas system CSM-associated protein Csm3 (group 7 of RAMP superfamily)
MKITINFYSAWAIGSGKGGDSKDSIILKDDNGLPFIPGRTLKGLIRDAFLECGYTDEDAIRLFGQIKQDNIKTEDLKAGTLRFNSAYLSGEFDKLPDEVKTLLFRAKTSTKLDNGKQAEDHSLRKNETTIPLELTGTILKEIDNSEIDNSDYEKIENALKMLKLMGEKRHRGLGRCKIAAKKFPKSTTIPKSITKETTDTEAVTKNTICFKCTVTEPLILVRKEKTEQNTDSLDYIPGNTFRGIVAGEIVAENSTQFDDIIFNNTVQFGDAHLLIDSKRSLKTPFSFFYDKSSNNNTLYYFHKLKGTDWTDKKLKAKKDGYLIEIKTEENSSFKIEKIEYGNRIKSSRDRKNRSSEDAGMFAHHYIKKGQEFEFEVSSTNTKYLKRIITILDGKIKYFGKSKTAEFGGAIKIKFDREEQKEQEEQKGKYLYAASNLCFLNEYGEFTIPTAKDLTGSDKNQIAWKKSQVKYRTFAPYNYHRRNYDFERLIIEKGSVFAFTEKVTFNANFLQKGIGCFLTEGYGKVLINPEFLNEKDVQLFSEKEEEKKTTNAEKKDADTNKILKQIEIKEDSDRIIKFLQTNYNKIVDEVNIDSVVANNKTTSGYKQHSSSQWARVFNATTTAKNYDDLRFLLFNKKKNNPERDKSIFTGGSKNWDNKDIEKVKSFLKNKAVESNEIAALRKLSKKMIAITKKREYETVSA